MRLKLKGKHFKRLGSVLGLWCSLGLAIALVVYAMKRHINLFFTPTQLIQNTEPIPTQLIRVGGWVVPKSVEYNSLGDTVTFQLSDEQHRIRVYYQGLLPDLFREGQGVVAQGYWRSKPPKACFWATQVLAKHDENYRPPTLRSH